MVLGAAMGATMGLGPAVRQAIVPDHLLGRVAATGRLIALCAGPVGAVFGGWLATSPGCGRRSSSGPGSLLTMIVVAARLTSNKRIEAALAEVAERREREELAEQEESLAARGAGGVAMV